MGEIWKVDIRGCSVGPQKKCLQFENTATKMIECKQTL